MYTDDVANVTRRDGPMRARERERAIPGTVNLFLADVASLPDSGLSLVLGFPENLKRRPNYGSDVCSSRHRSDRVGSFSRGYNTFRPNYAILIRKLFDTNSPTCTRRKFFVLLDKMYSTT